MKNECDIVGDLLFSYNDEILSNTSKQLVEEHLKVCEKCRKNLEEIKDEDTEKKQVKEIDFFKSIKKNINKKNTFIYIFLILFIILILFNIQVFNNYKEVASTMEVYLKDDITNEQIENIKNKIMEKSSNIELEYVSKEKALERLKNNLGNDKNILDEFNNENNPLASSIEIKTDTQIQTIVENIQDMPGIAHITTHINYNPFQLYIYNIFNK